MNNYNDMMMPNGNGPPLQQDFHGFSPSMSNANSLDHPYNHDLFMSSLPSGGPPPQQQMPSNRHMNVMQAQQQASIPSSQATMHQVKLFHLFSSAKDTLQRKEKKRK